MKPLKHCYRTKAPAGQPYRMGKHLYARIQTGAKSDSGLTVYRLTPKAIHTRRQQAKAVRRAALAGQLSRDLKNLQSM